MLFCLYQFIEEGVDVGHPIKQVLRNLTGEYPLPLFCVPKSLARSGDVHTFPTQGLLERSFTAALLRVGKSIDFPTDIGALAARSEFALAGGI